MSNYPEGLLKICLEHPLLKDLIQELAAEFKGDDNDVWISEKEAMHLLRITSKTTFQKYRDTGKIRFSRMTSKHILYKRTSILKFIESNIAKPK